MKYMILAFLFLAACNDPSAPTKSDLTPAPTKPAPTITLFVYGDQTSLPYANILAANMNWQVIDKTIHNGDIVSTQASILGDNWGPDDIVFLSPGLVDGYSECTIAICTSTGIFWTDRRARLQSIVDKLTSLNQKTIFASPLQSCKSWLHTGDQGLVVAFAEWQAVLPAAIANFLTPILVVNPGYVPTSLTTEVDCVTPTQASDQAIANIIQGVL